MHQWTPRGGRSAPWLGRLSLLLLAPVTLLAFPNPPVPFSGAPGESTCASCHGGGVSSGSVTLTFPGGLSYTPGVKQRVRVTVTESGKTRWGFELSPRLASNPTGSPAGDLANIDALSQVLCGDGSTKPAAGCGAGTPLQYAAQTSAGTQSGLADTASWDFDWTPPATDVGNVTFYLVGLAANNNGGPSGDDVMVNTFTLTPVAAPANPTLTLSPTSLAFASTGGVAPPTQTFRATSSGSALSFTLSASTTSGGSWLAAAPSGGTTPLDISVSVNPTGLAAGTYAGSVTVTSAGASNSPQTVGVTLTVSDATTPTISASPTMLSFALAGGSQAATQNLQVNGAPSGLAFTASAGTTSGGDWLSVSPLSGSVPATLAVVANPGSLSPGTYQGAITLSASTSNSPVTVPVTLLVTNSALTATPTSLSFNSLAGGAVNPQNVNVGSSGSMLSFDASATTNSGGNWLTVTPASGTTPGTLSVAANPTGLAAGTYLGTVLVTSGGASNSPLSIPVTLVVGAQTPPPSTSDLKFSFRVLDKQNPGAEQLMLSGEGEVSSGALKASGSFTQFIAHGDGKFTTTSNGTWVGKSVISFTPGPAPSGGKERDDSDEARGQSGGTLEISIEWRPKGGAPVDAVLRIVSTGSDSGVTLLVGGSPAFVPTGTGRVSIKMPKPKGNDHGDDDHGDDDEEGDHDR